MKSNPQIMNKIKHLENTHKKTSNFLQNTCKGLQRNGKKMGIRVNARYSGSKAVENTHPMSPYKIFLNDSNGHGCYFLKY
jgi:hypothetical protein